ncbi:unnamed protein product [Brassica oleracea]|uniref:Knottin scorpion toxin-like domain-containing protein n=1 Tax=Brassica oleracea TaxID=3712 RepID=A0A3P6A915_BRAOL|nr:unnamed protein product [Brassica oleracea]
MVITMKTLVMFVFTVFFIVFFVDCHTTTATVTTANTPGYGINWATKVCFQISSPCDINGRFGCSKFCDKWGYFYDHCEPYKCCCHR